MSRLIIVHDVLGTLFGFQEPVKTLQALFPNQLLPNPHLAELIIMDWYHSAQRDFTTLSINHSYQPFATVLKATLPRILLQAGISAQDDKQLSNPGLDLLLPHSDNPKGNKNPYRQEVIDQIMASFQDLQPRPGMVEAFTSLYRDPTLVPTHIHKVDLWAATNGGIKLTTQFFQNALGDQFPIRSSLSTSLSEGGGKEEDQELNQTLSTSAFSNQHSDRKESQRGDEKGKGVDIYSCDEDQVAKTDPRVYHKVLEKVKAGMDGNEFNKRDGQGTWFVASHTWDLFAAKKAGFKTAWVTYEEFYSSQAIFQQPDLVASDLADVAKKIMEWERNHS